ncbi:hypothetical protein EGW08_019835 [Elysia chlorotica]|uniref:Uncharacterized protein n=1 Tax=Elysia chlorotica TaxID=188477 RepID=A0A3S1BQG8_ELYCH|nr:hypothetical protein EGW08_019835 [Elysia chlorotica]
MWKDVDSRSSSSYPLIVGAQQSSGGGLVPFKSALYRVSWGSCTLQVCALQSQVGVLYPSSLRSTESGGGLVPFKSALYRVRWGSCTLQVCALQSSGGGLVPFKSALYRVRWGSCTLQVCAPQSSGGGLVPFKSALYRVQVGVLYPSSLRSTEFRLSRVRIRSRASALPASGDWGGARTVAVTPGHCDHTHLGQKEVSCTQGWTAIVAPLDLGEAVGTRPRST